MSREVMVKLYSKANCPYCVNAKNLLERRGVSFITFEYESMSPEQIEEMGAQCGSYRSFPKIVLEGRFIGGYSDLEALDQAGLLKK